jgi:hypothetical protein
MVLGGGGIQQSWRTPSQLPIGSDPHRKPSRAERHDGALLEVRTNAGSLAINRAP